MIISKRYTNFARNSRILSLSLLKNITRYFLFFFHFLTVNAKIIIKLFRSHHDQNLCGLLIYTKITITRRPPTCTTVNDAFVHFNLIIIQYNCIVAASGKLKKKKTFSSLNERKKIVLRHHLESMLIIGRSMFCLCRLSERYTKTFAWYMWTCNLNNSSHF